MYNGEFIQVLDISVSCKHHDDCLRLTNIIKKQCDAWVFNVSYQEGKSARKGDVLTRTLTIRQKAHAGDIVIFKEALSRVCEQLNILTKSKYVTFSYRYAEPVNDLRQQP